MTHTGRFHANSAFIFNHRPSIFLTPTTTTTTTTRGVTNNLPRYQEQQQQPQQERQQQAQQEQHAPGQDQEPQSQSNLPQRGQQLPKLPSIGLRSITRALWSIQVLIVVLLTVTVLATGLSIWGTNYSLSQRGVRSVADRATEFAMDNIATNVIQKMDQASLTSRVVLQQLAWSQKLHTQMLEKETPLLSLMRDLLWNTQVGSLMLGAPSGYYLAMENVDNNKTFHVFKSDPEKRILTSYVMDKDTLELTPGGFQPNVSNWFVTERPFYVTPSKTKVPEWVIYFDETVPVSRMIVSYCLPVVNNATSEVIAVMAGSFDIDDVNRYFSRLVKAQAGVGIIFTMEATGFILGSSTLVSADLVAQKRYRGDHHPNAKIRIPATEVLQRYNFSAPTTNGTRVSFRSSIDGEDYMVNGLVISDRVHTTWWIIHVYPEREIMRSVVLANKIALGVSMGAVVLALILALVFGLAITRPLNRISKQMKRVANMDLPEDTNRWGEDSLSLYEIHRMNNSMHQMIHGLLNFQKYVPGELVRMILKKNKEIALGVVSREMTVMFVDIKDFTTISEKFSHNTEHLVALVSVFFTEMSDIVMQHLGVIDKYLGDGMMCLFNAPCNVDFHAEKTVRAAVAMLKRLEELNSSWLKEGLPSIEIRVGINTDLCLVGNVGSVNRFDYTALGDPVNVASRLEGLNKRYGTNIIIGQKTYEAVKDEFACRWISYLAMKGKAQPMHVYEVLCKKEEASDLQNQECQLHEQLRAAFDSLDRDEAIVIEEIQRICNQLLAMDEWNLAARELLERSTDTNFSLRTVYILTEK